VAEVLAKMSNRRSHARRTLYPNCLLLPRAVGCPARACLQLSRMIAATNWTSSIGVVSTKEPAIQHETGWLHRKAHGDAVRGRRSRRSSPRSPYTISQEKRLVPRPATLTIEIRGIE
jgi:hypothetical protein